MVKKTNELEVPIIKGRYGKFNLSKFKGKDVLVYTERHHIEKIKGKCVGISNSVLLIEGFFRKKRKFIFPVDTRNVHRIFIREISGTESMINSFNDMIGEDITVERLVSQRRKIRGNLVDASKNLLLVRGFKKQNRIKRGKVTTYIFDTAGTYSMRIFLDPDLPRTSSKNSPKMILEKAEKRRTKDDEESPEQFNKKYYEDLEDWSSEE